MSALFNQFIDKFPVYFSVEGSIPAMLGLVFFSKLLHALLSLGLLQKYDIVQAGYRNASTSPTSKWAEKTVVRAYNAHMNQWEAFICFSSAVLLALVKNVASKELQKLTNAFLFVRLMYNMSYIVAFNEPLSMIRSTVFTIGVVIIFSIFSLSVGSIF